MELLQRLPGRGWTSTSKSRSTDAFEGRLVEQRPEDGDARELLERIKVDLE